MNATTSPIVVSGEVVRVLSYNRVQLRLAVWPSVEVLVEARMEGLEQTLPPARHDSARQCAIILMGGKKIIAHIDRRAAVPIVRIYRTVRHPISGHMAENVSDGCGPLLFVNSFLQSLAPNFSAECVTRNLNH